MVFERFFSPMGPPCLARHDGAPGGYDDDILDGGNVRATVSRKHDNHDAFDDMMAEATVRSPTRIPACRLEPNHISLAR